MQMRSRKALTAASLASLLAAVVLSLPLLDRFGAVAWQWYKLGGYSNDGYISLSLKTGWIFTSALCAVFLLALLLNRAAKRHDLARPSAWSRSAMYLVAAVMISYWGLGLSSVNVWRP